MIRACLHSGIRVTVNSNASHPSILYKHPSTDILLLYRHPSTIQTLLYYTDILILYRHSSTMQASFYYIYRHPSTIIKSILPQSLYRHPSTIITSILVITMQTYFYYASIPLLHRHPSNIQTSFYYTGILLQYTHPSTIITSILVRIMQTSFYHTGFLLLCRHPFYYNNKHPSNYHAHALVLQLLYRHPLNQSSQSNYLRISMQQASTIIQSTQPVNQPIHSTNATQLMHSINHAGYVLESLGLLVCGALMQCTCPCSPAPLFKVLVIKIHTVRLDSRHMSLLTTSLIQGPGDQDTHTKGVQSCMHPIGLICIVMCCWLCCLGARSCLFNVGLMLVCINLCSHHLEGRCECMCLCSLYIPLCLQSRRSLVL